MKLQLAIINTIEKRFREFILFIYAVFELLAITEQFINRFNSKSANDASVVADIYFIVFGYRLLAIKRLEIIELMANGFQGSAVWFICHLCQFSMCSTLVLIRTVPLAFRKWKTSLVKEVCR